MKTQRRTVAVIFGGQSTEHEISCRSAAFLFREIPRDRYQVAALAVTKNGRLIPQNLERIEREQNPTVAIYEGETADPVSQQVFQRLCQFLGNGQGAEQTPAPDDGDLLVFSIMHGTFGEDGCWQGYWELAGLPYVGADVLGSAIAMDKEIAKKLVSLAGVPIVPYSVVQRAEWQKNRQSVLDRIQNDLAEADYFIKPANLGSSVGVSRAKNRQELEKAVSEAFTFDTKVLIEKAMNVREIEFAVLSGEETKVSLPGEVAASSGFYSYESKYIDAEGAKILIPAPLSEAQIQEGQELALKAFHALNLFGLARIDLFLDKQNGQYFFNEANTLPGFTNISQYPMLWQHMGLSPAQLLHELLETARYRWLQKRTLNRAWM